MESFKGQKIQKEPAQPERHMESIQSKTNVALGKEKFIDHNAECRGSVEILKPGLSKALINFPHGSSTLYWPLLPFHSLALGCIYPSVSQFDRQKPEGIQEGANREWFKWLSW